jgi:inner membrane protein
VAAVVAPAPSPRCACRRRHLPDLDSCRGPAHRRSGRAHDLASQRQPFAVRVAAAGWAIWAFFRRRGAACGVAGALVLGIQLALVTHPLLDAFTVYGTQLWWPLMPPPTMWSSVFIIDPLYTIWLLVACVHRGMVATRARRARVLAGRC